MPSFAAPSVPLSRAEPTPVGVALSTPRGDEASPSPWTWHPIPQELLRQPRTDDLALYPPAKERMAMLFTLMHEVPLDGDLWTETAELAWLLGRQGIVLPLTDVAIAACSRRAGATLITTDRHFAMIPGLRIRASI